MRKLVISTLLFLCLILVGCSTSKQSSGTESLTVSPPSGVSIFPNINRIQISWAANSFVDYFIIYRSISGADDFIRIGTSTNNGFSDAVIQYNTTYEYSVSAVYAGNVESDRTNPVYGSISNEVAPSPPSALNVVETEDDITVRWTASDDEDLYYFDIYRSLSKNTGFEQINDVPVFKTFSQYLDVNVIEDITYFYRIKSIDVAGNESHFSDFVSGNRIDRVPPSQPNFLDFEIDEENVSVTLNWDLNSESDIAEYRIYRATLEETIPQLIATVSAELDYYFDNDILQNTVYDYYMSAYDDDGNESVYSDRLRISIEDVVAPDTPSNITTTFNYSSITLDWDDNSESDLAGYQLYRATSLEGTYTRQNINTLTSSTYTDTAVERTVTYYYKLVAQDIDANFSATSDVIEVSYFPEIETYTVQDALTIELDKISSGETIATLTYSTDYIDNFYGESGLTRTTLVETSEEEGSVTTRIYTKKVSGVIYMYIDTAPFVGASGNSESFEFTEYIQDGAKAGYSSDFVTILGFEEITGPDETQYYVAKVLDENNESETHTYYIGETFLYLGGFTGEEESPDTTKELTSFEE
jgi:fibronectin type 3 domain-containing protein